MRRVLKEDIKLKSQQPFKTFNPTNSRKKKRHDWAKNVKMVPKGCPSPSGKVDIGRIRFSDEKVSRIKEGGKIRRIIDCGCLVTTT